MSEPPENMSEAPEKKVRHRRMRHEWREATNPLDQFVSVAGWIFLIAMLATVVFFIWRAATGAAE